MKNILLGLVIISFGFLLVWKSYWVVSTFGKSDWAENKLGSSGGTNLLYKLIGILIILFGMLTVSGLRDQFLLSTLGKLFTGMKK